MKSALRRTFDDFSFAVGFACLDELGAGGVKLEAVRLVSILDLPDLDVFQGDNAARLLVRRVLEVVQAVVVEDEPAPLPALVASTCRPCADRRKKIARGLEFGGAEAATYQTHTIRAPLAGPCDYSLIYLLSPRTSSW